MKQIIIALIGLIALFQHASAQINAVLNKSAFGIYAAKPWPANTQFVYQGDTVSKYSLGWYFDTDGLGGVNGAPIAYISSSGGIKFFAQEQMKMYMTALGNLGVGVASPYMKIQAGGTIYSDVASATANTPNFYWGNTAAVNTTGDKHAAIWLDNNGEFRLRSVTGKGFAFRNTSNTTNIINITDNGMVVGDTIVQPAYKFAVNGAAIATSITVKARAAWPDYVFKNNYVLRSLPGLKTYIDRHGHLPGIPSAQTIAANGIDLGEMNRQLLKKVEELTLYLIAKDRQDRQKNKKLKSLQQQVDQLKKHLN